MDVDTEHIRCPRCNDTMDIFSKQTPGGRIVADMCLVCGGVWFDGAEVAKAYPAFHDLGDRLAGAPLGEAPVHIAACPRCGQTPVGFRFFDLALDHCASCQGLWVDGDELLDLARTADRTDGLPAPAPVGYRTNAGRAVRSNAVPCKTCGAELQLAAAELTSEGPMCAACAQRFRDAALDASLEGWQPPKEPLLNMAGVGEALSAVGEVLGFALASHSPCLTCGCNPRSGCGHR